MAEKVVKIGLVGFGTVGSGVAKLILEDADLIAAKTGLRLQLACVVDIDTKSPRPVKLPEGILTDDLSRLLKDDTIQIGIEMIGGTDIAKQVQLKMLAAGKDVLIRGADDVLEVRARRVQLVAARQLVERAAPVRLQVAIEMLVVEFHLRSAVVRAVPAHSGMAAGRGRRA